MRNILLDEEAFRREVELIALDPFYRIDWPHDGTRLDFYGDIPRMQEALAELSPADAATIASDIGEMTDAARGTGDQSRFSVQPEHGHSTFRMAQGRSSARLQIFV